MLKKQVLIVDDDAVCLMVLSLLVREMGFDVLEAASGEQALLMLNPFLHKVVTDMHMGKGKMNGNDVAGLAKSQRTDLGIILLYSPFEIDPKEELFSHILEKPVNLCQLSHALQ